MNVFRVCQRPHSSVLRRFCQLLLSKCYCARYTIPSMEVLCILAATLRVMCCLKPCLWRSYKGLMGVLGPRDLFLVYLAFRRVSVSSGSYVMQFADSSPTSFFQIQILITLCLIHDPPIRHHQKNGYRTSSCTCR